MIIRKKNIKSKKTSTDTPSKKITKGNVIKKEDAILNIENVKNTNTENKTPLPEKIEINKQATQENFEKIDISSIDFKERMERRRGDRRRGYRRLDERSLVSRAQQEAHNIKELASREGYKQGLEKAQNQIEDIKKELVKFLSLKDEMYEDFYPYIMEISMAVAKKIIKKETEISKDVLKEIIMTVMEEINPDAQKIEIKVNSQDYEFAKASLPEIMETNKTTTKITIGQDDIIETGSCIVIANNGVIDANFKTQLAVLQNAFGIYKGGL